MGSLCGPTADWSCDGLHLLGQHVLLAAARTAHSCVTGQRSRLCRVGKAAPHVWTQAPLLGCPSMPGRQPVAGRPCLPGWQPLPGRQPLLGHPPVTSRLLVELTLDFSDTWAVEPLSLLSHWIVATRVGRSCCPWRWIPFPTSVTGTSRRWRTSMFTAVVVGWTSPFRQVPRGTMVAGVTVLAPILIPGRSVMQIRARLSPGHAIGPQRAYDLQLNSARTALCGWFVDFLLLFSCGPKVFSGAWISTLLSIASCNFSDAAAAFLLSFWDLAFLRASQFSVSHYSETTQGVCVLHSLSPSLNWLCWQYSWLSLFLGNFGADSLEDERRSCESATLSTRVELQYQSQNNAIFWPNSVVKIAIYLGPTVESTQPSSDFSAKCKILPGMANGYIKWMMTFHWWGENSSEDPGREPATMAQVRLRTENGFGRKILCCEIFAWDRLASQMYAAKATTCLMKICIAEFRETISWAYGRKDDACREKIK